MRVGLRGRVLIFFVALAAGSLGILALGIWFGYHREKVTTLHHALTQAGIAIGFGLSALICWAWFLFDRYFARPIKGITAAMHARTHADVTDDLHVMDAEHLGELSVAASSAIATLNRARSDLAETVARETSRLLADRSKLEQMLSDVPPAVLLCTGRHHVAFYNSVAQQLLGTRYTPVCLDRSLFDYLGDHEIRHAHRRLLERGMPDAVLEFVCVSGARRLAGRMRLAGDNDGDAGAYVMTLRDVTEEVAAFGRRDALLRDVFTALRPMIGTPGSPAGDGSLRETGAIWNWEELEHRYQACEADGWPTTLAGALNSVAQTFEPFSSPAATLPRTVVYDFDLLSRVSRDVVADAELDDLNYVVFDTETTGLLPERGDELVQIAAVRIVNGKLMPGEVFDTFVNPGRPIPSASTAIHRVTDAMVAEAPDVLHVVERFHKFVGNCVLVAHNAPFDMAFLHRREKALGIQFDKPVLDTGIISVMTFGQHESHTLDALASRLAISIPAMQRHTALGDAVATAEVFLKLKGILMGRGITRFGDLVAHMRQNRTLSDGHRIVEGVRKP